MAVSLSNIKNDVSRGFETAGWLLLTFLAVLLLLFGAGVVFTDRENLEFSNIALAKGVAWVALVLGATITISLVDRWVKILPGILFLASIKALIVSMTGHMLNNPSMPVSRWVAISSLLLLGASGYVSLRYQDKELTKMERVSLLLFVACLVWGAAQSLAVPPLAAGLAALLATRLIK